MKNSTEEKARIALKNRLFVNGWSLNGFLHSAILSPKKYDLRLHKEKDKYVGVALLDKLTGQIQVFVKKEYRRRGIGSKLIKRFGNKVKCAGYGVIGSREFYSKLDISVEW